MKDVLPVNPLPPVKKIFYLLALTVGCALIVLGICWAMELGCAIILYTQLLTGRFSGGNRFTACFGYGIILFALASGGWMFMVAYRSGQVWLRAPVQWWWYAFIGFMWLMNLITELRRVRNPQ